MKRVIQILNAYNGFDKYVLCDEYRTHGIYQEVAPSGFRVANQWVILRPSGDLIIVDSYNNVIKEEIYDIIDSGIDNDTYGLTGFDRPAGFIVHKAGDCRM